MNSMSVYLFVQVKNKLNKPHLDNNSQKIIFRADHFTCNGESGQK